MTKELTHSRRPWSLGSCKAHEQSARRALNATDEKFAKSSTKFGLAHAVLYTGEAVVSPAANPEPGTTSHPPPTAAVQGPALSGEW